jgi:CDP-glycerol glycerophosphotransferase
MKSKLILYIRVFLYYLFRVFPIKKNKIFIQNFNGKGYGDNPKYIVEEILRRNLNFVLVWAVVPKLSVNFPQRVKTVPYKSIRAIYEEATAKIWIDNCRKQLYVRKRKEQYYIQTWHAAVNFKKVEKDVEQNLSAYYVQQAKHDSTLANLALSDNKFSSQLYRSAFWYNGEIFECGSPRDDILIDFKSNQDIMNKVKNYFKIADNIKIILYAPTFRDNSNLGIYNIDYELLLNGLQEQTKEPWVFLIRLHPNISEKSGIISYSESIFNASNYDDMQELMLASDILITDYSDCMYEFALMNKPVFLYANDYKQYEKERGFYFDIFSMPFPCAVNNNDLLQNMLHFDTAHYLNSLAIFFKKVGIVKNGDASKKVVDKIVTEIEK